MCVQRRIPKSLVAELKEVHAKVFESGVQDESEKDDLFSGLRPGSEESVMLRQIRQGYVMKPLYTYCMHWTYDDEALFARMKQLMVRVGREVFRLGDKEVWRLELFVSGFVSQFFNVAVDEAEWRELDRMEKELKEREDRGDADGERGDDVDVGEEDDELEPDDSAAVRLRRKRNNTAATATSVAAAIAAEKADGMEVESDAGSVAVGSGQAGAAAGGGGKAQKKAAKSKKARQMRSRQRRPAVKDELKSADAEEEEEEKEDEVEVDVDGGRADSRLAGKKPQTSTSGSKADEEKDSADDDDGQSSTTNRPRMSPTSTPGSSSTHSIASITRDILAADLSLPSPSTLKPMTVALSSFTLDQSLHPVRRHSRPSHLFFGSNAFYVFFRLHQFLYDRLHTAKQLAYKPRKGSAKKKIPFSGDERWQRFNSLLDEFVKGEDKGESRFEDECRNLLGASSYVLFTMDKLVHQLIKQMLALLNSEVSMQLLQLYAIELRRANAAMDAAHSEREKEEASARVCRQYQYAVSLALNNDNVTQMECFLDQRELGIGLVEGLALSDGQGNLGTKVIAFQEPHDAEYHAYLTAFINGTVPSVKAPALRRNIARGQEVARGGGVGVRNGLEVKICMKTYRLLYVEDSEDVLVRRVRRETVQGGAERKEAAAGKEEIMREWALAKFAQANPNFVAEDYMQLGDEGEEDVAMRVEGEGGEVGEGGEQEEEDEGVDGEASEGLSISASPSPAPPTAGGSQGGALFSAVAAAQHSAEQGDATSPAPTPSPSSPIEVEGNGV